MSIFKIKQILFLLMFLKVFFGINALASDTDYVIEFMENMSNQVVQLYCNASDDMFLKFTRLTKSECEILVSEYSEECNNIIMPLMPPMTTNDEDILKYANEIKNISTLYRMCIRSSIYEKTIESINKN